MIQAQLKLRLNSKQEALLAGWLWNLTGVWNWAVRKIELDAEDHMNQMNRKGRKQSPEHIAARSAALNGRRCWNKGKHWSDEVKKKLSESGKGARNSRYQPNRELVAARLAARRFMKDCIRRLLINKNSSCADLLGYDRDQLIAHLESLFTSEMNWSNYGDFWEIDHVRSIAAYVLDGDTSPASVCALTNLRPLRKGENRSKGSRDCNAAINTLIAGLGMSHEVFHAQV